MCIRGLAAPYGGASRPGDHRIAGNAAVARVETPWFVDYFHLGRFGDRWVIVNALWYPKPKS